MPTESMPATPELERLLVVTPHSSGQVPADILREMLGEDVFDTPRREAFLRQLFLDGDPYTDLIYALPGARFLGAPWSRFAADLNRERDDHSDNGVLKLVDFDRQPLYPAGFRLTAQARESHLRRLWDSFDTLLRQELEVEKAGQGTDLLIVGHCMAPHGPKLGHDTGTPRPGICLMLGQEAAPTFPRQHWQALQAACEQAFAPALAKGGVPGVSIGVPWDTDTLSAAHGPRSGVPAFGIELNSALYLHDLHGQQPKDDMLRDLNAAFGEFASAALRLVGQG